MSWRKQMLTVKKHGPKKPWHDDLPVKTNKQTFAHGFKWCRILHHPTKSWLLCDRHKRFKAFQSQGSFPLPKQKQTKQDAKTKKRKGPPSLGLSSRSSLVKMRNLNPKLKLNPQNQKPLGKPQKKEQLLRSPRADHFHPFGPG